MIEIDLISKALFFNNMYRLSSTKNIKNVLMMLLFVWFGKQL